MNDPLTLLIADDHGLVRDMLANRLNGEPDMTVVGTAENAADAIDLAMRTRPDMLIMDIDMPGKSSFEAVREIRLHHPSTRAVFLSAYANDCYIDQALAVEAIGYVTKDEPPEALIRAIRVALRSGFYFSPRIQSRLVIGNDGVRLSPCTRSRLTMLTSRETEVLQHLALGRSKKEIAQTMHLSVKTVDTHSGNLMKKLDIHDRVELARYAIREGLINA